MNTPRTQRRLVAILAADVVGYSRLMGQDEAGTLAALKVLRTEIIDPKVAEHSGRIFKPTGNGCLVEFPSVVNAMICVVSIQKAMPEDSSNHDIQLRIGLLSETSSSKREMFSGTGSMSLRAAIFAAIKPTSKSDQISPIYVSRRITVC
jgi:class 3 adenylate cyclase